MPDINSVVLVGRLTRDLGEKDMGYLPNGTARANVSIAVNRSRKQSDGTWSDDVSYFDITLWGKTAENLKPYLSKGKQIAVEGHLRQERWQDKQTGNNRSRVSVVADNIQLLGGKSDSRQDGGQSAIYEDAQRHPQYQPTQSQSPVQQQAGFDGGFEEDIPF